MFISAQGALVASLNGPLGTHLASLSPLTSEKELDRIYIFYVLQPLGWDNVRRQWYPGMLLVVQCVTV